LFVSIAFENRKTAFSLLFAKKKIIRLKFIRIGFVLDSLGAVSFKQEGNNNRLASQLIIWMRRSGEIPRRFAAVNIVSGNDGERGETVFV
jgi:hypothetical protein